MEPQDRRSEQTTAAPSESSTGSRRHAMRLVRDNDEGFVLVYELTGLHASDPRSLVIEWGGGRQIVRLYHYPANWRQLKDHELLGLRPEVG